MEKVYFIPGYMPPTSLSVSYGIELDTLGEELQTAGKLLFRKNTFKICQESFLRHFNDKIILILYSALTNEELVYMKQTWTRDRDRLKLASSKVGNA